MVGSAFFAYYLAPLIALIGWLHINYVLKNMRYVILSGIPMVVTAIAVYHNPYWNHLIFWAVVSIQFHVLIFRLILRKWDQFHRTRLLWSTASLTPLVALTLLFIINHPSYVSYPNFESPNWYILTYMNLGLSLLLIFVSIRYPLHLDRKSKVGHRKDHTLLGIGIVIVFSLVMGLHTYDNQDLFACSGVFSLPLALIPRFIGKKRD